MDKKGGGRKKWKVTYKSLMGRPCDSNGLVLISACLIESIGKTSF